MKEQGWPYARVIAHRGGGTLAPENTIAAIRSGIARGFRAVEFDAMLPRDEVPILMHDPMLGRTVSGPGAVTDRTAAEMAGLDAGAWHSTAFAGERVPTLAAALAFCRAEGVWPNVEIKPAPGRERATGRAVASLVARAYADELRPRGSERGHVVARVPLLSSFSMEALEAAREAAPDLPRGWLVDRVPSDWRARCESLGAVALHANHRHLARGRVDAIREAGFWLFCYTVNDVERARLLLGWGIDAFCTDAIDVIGPDFASGR